jgi:hypothetical protein
VLSSEVSDVAAPDVAASLCIDSPISVILAVDAVTDPIVLFNG